MSVFFLTRHQRSDDLVMAIDAGTGSCRSAIFDSSGNQISLSQSEWSHKPSQGFPASQVFETRANWRLISLCIRDCVKKAGISPNEIRAVSATSMREGMVLYDESGNEIWACPNVDSRAKSEAEWLVRTGKARRIFGLSGDWVSITSPARFLWIKKHEPEVFDKIEHIGMLSDWIVYKLSGEFFTDPSAGSSSGMFDLSKREWSSEIAAMCGLRREIFPRVVASGKVAGGVTKKAAKETGFVEGTPVVVGGADTQLGLVGLGATGSNQVTLLGGSFWQLTMLLDRPLIDPESRLRTLCHASPGRWMIEGIGFYSGLVMRWFRDAFCESEKEKAAKLGVDPYVLMDEEASLVPAGSNGIFGIFSNIMNSKRWTHASPAFVQFDITTPSQSGKKECIRSIEESAAYVTLGHLRILESLVRRKSSEITFVGGGSRSNLWPQIVSDVLGVRVNVPVVKESTALGAAICAGVGAGFYKSIETMGRSMVRLERTYEPRKVDHMKYLSLYNKWFKIYSEEIKISGKGLLNPLWQAAGV